METPKEGAIEQLSNELSKLRSDLENLREIHSPITHNNRVLGRQQILEPSTDVQRQILLFDMESDVNRTMETLAEKSLSPDDIRDHIDDVFRRYESETLHILRLMMRELCAHVYSVNSETVAYGSNPAPDLTFSVPPSNLRSSALGTVPLPNIRDLAASSSESDIPSQSSQESESGSSDECEDEADAWREVLHGTSSQTENNAEGDNDNNNNTGQNQPNGDLPTTHFDLFRSLIARVGDTKKSKQRRKRKGTKKDESGVVEGSRERGAGLVVDVGEDEDEVPETETEGPPVATKEILRMPLTDEMLKSHRNSGGKHRGNPSRGAGGPAASSTTSATKASSMIRGKAESVSAEDLSGRDVEAASSGVIPGNSGGAVLSDLLHALQEDLSIARIGVGPRSLKGKITLCLCEALGFYSTRLTAAAQSQSQASRSDAAGGSFRRVLPEKFTSGLLDEIYLRVEEHVINDPKIFLVSDSAAPPGSGAALELRESEKLVLRDRVSKSARAVLDHAKDLPLDERHSKLITHMLATTLESVCVSISAPSVALSSALPSPSPLYQSSSSLVAIETTPRPTVQQSPASNRGVQAPLVATGQRTPPPSTLRSRSGSGSGSQGHSPVSPSLARELASAKNQHESRSPAQSSQRSGPPSPVVPRNPRPSDHSVTKSVPREREAVADQTAEIPPNRRATARAEGGAAPMSNLDRFLKELDDATSDVYSTNERTTPQTQLPSPQPPTSSGRHSKYELSPQNLKELDNGRGASQGLYSRWDEEADVESVHSYPELIPKHTVTQTRWDEEVPVRELSRYPDVLNLLPVVFGRWDEELNVETPRTHTDIITKNTELSNWDEEMDAESVRSYPDSLFSQRQIHTSLRPNSTGSGKPRPTAHIHVERSAGAIPPFPQFLKNVDMSKISTLRAQEESALAQVIAPSGINLLPQEELFGDSEGDIDPDAYLAGFAAKRSSRGARDDTSATGASQLDGMVSPVRVIHKSGIAIPKKPVNSKDGKSPPK